MYYSHNHNKLVFTKKNSDQSWYHFPCACLLYFPNISGDDVHVSWVRNGAEMLNWFFFCIKTFSMIPLSRNPAWCLEVLIHICLLWHILQLKQAYLFLKKYAWELSIHFACMQTFLPLNNTSLYMQYHVLACIKPSLKLYLDKIS